MPKLDRIRNEYVGSQKVGIILAPEQQPDFISLFAGINKILGQDVADPFLIVGTSSCLNWTGSETNISDPDLI
jgi:hypothetical protein